MRRGKEWVQRVLVKQKGFAEPNWEDQYHSEDNEAFDKFEALFSQNDGVGELEGARKGTKWYTRSSKIKIKNIVVGG